VGVSPATSGPGACNLVTGLADANSDSTAVVAITGNVPSHLLGKTAFQEADIVAITEPFTKASIQVERVGDIPATVRRAFSLAHSNRHGPVLVDIPKDLQQHYPRRSRRSLPCHRASRPSLTCRKLISAVFLTRNLRNVCA